VNKCKVTGRTFTGGREALFSYLLMPHGSPTREAVSVECM
jgi:hypothetical protein